MKRTVRLGLLSLVAVSVFAIFAASAAATPGRSGVCSGCHSGVNVPVTATPVSNNGATATYSFSAPSADAVAVFNGASKVTVISSSGGQFTVPTGSTYTLYAVAGPDTNDGIGSTTVSPVAPTVDGVDPVTTSDAKSSYSGPATIKLTATDNVGGSGVAATYYRLDGGSTVPGVVVNVSTSGSHSLEFWSVDVAGNTEAHKFANFKISSTSFISIAGATRYETAVQASKEAFATGANSVVIATGANWPDALGGGAFAAAKGAPILLTGSQLPASVLTEINRLGATQAYVLGGTGAVSSAVENALKSQLGASNVTRIGGANRYQTAELIAQATIDEINKTGTYDGTAFVATGSNFPDALAATPLSAAKGWPLFLSGPGGLSASTKSAMGAGGVDEVLLLGGTGAISSSVESGLKGTYGASMVTRLAGANRYATAVTVATYGCDTAGLSWDGLAVATGGNFPDALAGGVMQGKAGSVMLLTTSKTLDASTSACLSENRSEIAEVKYLGGEGALGATVRSQVSAILN